MLDYIIVHQKDRWDVHITHCIKDADCLSDHWLVCSKMYIQLARKNQMERQKPYKSLNLSRLHTNSSALQEKVKEMLGSSDIVAMNPNDGWKAFMESTYDSATEILGLV